jgi:hypothetical protein
VTTASKLFVKVAAGSGASLLLLLGSHGRSAGRGGPMPCARRQRSERSRARVRRSSGVNRVRLRSSFCRLSALSGQARNRGPICPPMGFLLARIPGISGYAFVCWPFSPARKAVERLFPLAGR